LLIVQNLAQLLEVALEKGVASFEFRQSVVSHTGRLAESRGRK